MLKYLPPFLALIGLVFGNCYSNEGSIAGEESKIYIQPGWLQITQEGILIPLDHQAISVDHLEVDERGVYFDRERLKISYCETCGLPEAWGKCLNPKCPSKKKKK
ncbi:MAG: hypothetical protein BGO14_09385 [Chlamydiales bacterium 38-26]|nr:hypothetical protein [Chlamydiales bacterium]OJV11188.1 MAG: hypothetical protein BGO14_09385 [Chlamydiales bacterium 38-26]